MNLQHALPSRLGVQRIMPQHNLKFSACHKRMPGCAAYSCSNSSKKGFYMARFPKDTHRRALWIAAVNRPQLELMSATALCEIHFDEASWEKVRVDGTRKLKNNALPTKFLPSSGYKRRDHLLTPKASDKNEHTLMVFTAPTNAATSEQLTAVKIVRNPIDHCSGFCTPDYNAQESSAISRYSQRSALIPDSNLEDHYVCNRLLEGSESDRKILMTKLEAAQTKNPRLHANQVIVSKDVFDHDQLDVLKRNLEQCAKWSSDRIKKGLKLKSSRGNTVYRKLLGKSIPLPCLRISSQKMEYIHLDSGV